VPDGPLGLETVMAIEELDDIAEELADKLGIYSEERQHWTYEFKQRVRQAVKIEQTVAVKRVVVEWTGDECSFCKSSGHDHCICPEWQ
jgi:hypothetical protein